MEDEDISLSDEDVRILTLGPQFCVLNNLSEETFEPEVEECIIKYRWELKKCEDIEAKNKKFGEDTIETIYCLFTEEKLEQQTEED